jgi:hypothetical protein
MLLRFENSGVNLISSNCLHWKSTSVTNSALLTRIKRTLRLLVPRMDPRNPSKKVFYEMLGKAAANGMHCYYDTARFHGGMGILVSWEANASVYIVEIPVMLLSSLYQAEESTVRYVD